MNNELKIGKTLRTLMSSENETIVSLSKKTSIPRSTISDWLSNRTPNPVQASKVANHFSVSLHYLLFGIEDRSEPLSKMLKEDIFSGTFEITVKKVRVK